MKRPSRDEYFMGMAKLAATRSTCMRRKVGAVAVKNDHVLATGYNGAPRGLPHCEDVGCIRERDGIPSGEKHELCRGVHAEQNLICQAAYHGVSLAGADIYCTNQPCSICAKMLLNVGIGAVYYTNGYPDDMTLEILGDRLFRFDGGKPTYTPEEVRGIKRSMLKCSLWEDIKSGGRYVVINVAFDSTNATEGNARVHYYKRGFTTCTFSMELSEFKLKFEPCKGD